MVKYIMSKKNKGNFKMNQEKYKKLLEYLNKEEKAEIIKIIESFKIPMDYSQESVIAGIEYSIENIAKFFKGELLNNKTFNNIGTYELPLDVDILKKNPCDVHLNKFLFDFKYFIENLEENKKNIIKEIIIELSKVKLERYKHYMFSGINNQSSKYWLAKMDINQRILRQCF